MPESTTATSSAELCQFLESTHGDAITTPVKDVVEITTDMTPVEAAKKLWENNVLGAPVWDDTTKKYLGFFDMRDLLSTVVATHKEKEEGQDECSGKDTNMPGWFSSTATNPTTFTVSYLAARDSFVSLTDDATLKDILKVASADNCHRVPIVDKESGRCIRILSQSAMVKFLVKHLADDTKTNELFNVSLSDVGTALAYKKPVVSAPDTATARDVFELMDSNRLSGIAIVDPSDGSLMGNTSASDIKLAVAVEEGMVADLNLDILSYVTAVRLEKPGEEARYPSTHVREDATVGHVMRLLAKTGYHRVFVVDDARKPIGVVSVRDIVRYVVEQVEQSD